MKIVDSEKLTNLDWLNIFSITYVDKNRRRRNWLLASRSGEPKCITGDFSQPDAVVIVAFHKTRQRLVITREYRVPLADYEYGFPAGLVDAGETVQEAAGRELKEETGLELTRFIKIGAPIYSSAGMTDESVSMVYVECDGEPSDTANEGSEDIEVLFVSQKEVRRLCNDPTLKFDAKAWIVLSNFGEFGRV